MSLQSHSKQYAVPHVFAGATFGLVGDFLYLVWIARQWPFHWIRWPSDTDVMHQTYFIMPQTGWEIRPITFGLLGIVFPIVFACMGWCLARWRPIKLLQQEDSFTAMGCFWIMFFWCLMFLLGLLLVEN